MEIKYSTGNKIVDAVGEMNFTGNVIPEAWYHTITNQARKPCPLAILLLADIVYWYRPTEKRDETTQNVRYEKKFYDDDYLQRSYDQITNKFGISKKQAREALIVLEDLGVVKRHFKDIVLESGMKLRNVMFLELNPNSLKRITFPSNDHIYEKVNTSLQKRNDLVTKKESRHYENGKTNTKNSSKITTKTPTTSEAVDLSIVDEVKDIFKGFHFSDKDILSIVKASGNDINKCINAKVLLEQQSSRISNAVGWLIKAIKENYQPVSYTTPKKNNSFNNFHQREYSDDYWQEIERQILATQSSIAGLYKPHCC